MFKIRYLIRLDDACPTMSKKKWKRIETLLDNCGIKPMVGIIPHNEDPQQIIDSDDGSFWARVGEWDKKGWKLALHGFNHCYSSEKGLEGLNPMWTRSEFSGLPLEDQLDKIRKGVAIFQQHGFNPSYFFAPSHTFDENTLIALREESDIRVISDTIALKPYRYKDFVFIPQFGGHCRDMKFPGLFTFCLHPDTMREEDFVQTESFINTHKKEFISFDEINISAVKAKTMFDCFFRNFYFLVRKLRQR